MGLLPFRVWQLYDAMVDALDEGSKDKFLCAAGTLAHYIGDSCQPLHISYLHHGDPDHPVTRIVKHTRGKKAGTSDTVNDSANVHEDYEQTMFRNDTGETVKTKLEAQLNRMTRSARSVCLSCMADQFVFLVTEQADRGLVARRNAMADRKSVV